ncbi:MAG TPA: CHAT domain-containing protein [Candidatus Sulfotelmatobacter sp.]
MKGQKPIHQPARRLFWTLMLAAVVLSAFGQDRDPQSLQNRGIARIDKWTDSVRRTGDAKSTVSELAAAQVDLKASIDLFRQQKDYARASLSTDKLATIQRLQSQWQQAAQIYQAAIELAKRANRTDYQTTALADLAFSELQLGDVDAAEEDAREAVRLGVDCGNKNFYFDALDRAAEIELKRGNLVAAGDSMDRALAISEQLDDKRRLYSAYLDRGDIYAEVARKCDYQHNYDLCNQSLELARIDYQRALRITQEAGYLYFSQLVQVYLRGLDDRKAMLQSLQHGDQTVNATKLFTPQKPKDVLVTEYFTNGAADPATLAPLESAVKDLRAWHADLKGRGLTVPIFDPSDLCLEGQLAEMKGNNDAALVAYLHADAMLEKDRRKLGEEQARGAFLEDKLSCYYRPALLLLGRKLYAEAFGVFERSRSRAMADLLTSHQLSLRSDLERTLFSQQQLLKATIAAKQEKLFNLSGSRDRDKNINKIVELQGETADLQNQFEQLQHRIAKEAPKLEELTAAQPATLPSVQQAAADGNYDVLYYVVMEHALIVWHIDGATVNVKNVFLPHVQLIQKVAALRDSLVAPRDSPEAHFDLDTSRQLFLYLIQPMLAFVKSRRLVLVPHEELNSIPFQALQDPATGKYLGESFAISYAPSATVLANLEDKSNPQSGRLLAVADPSIHDASDEVRAIGRLYPGRSKVVAQDAASKDDLKAWVENYDVVHLSVHGSFNSSDPLLSYLQFKERPSDNGRMTAAEMFGLPLQKNSLVVLSACETGRAEATHSNEILGMVRSLLYAGAGRLVLSSWEVNARSTRLWMETFYKQRQANQPAEAARLALIAVKSHPEYSHPFFWAPFVMTGK